MSRTSPPPVAVVAAHIVDMTQHLQILDTDRAGPRKKSISLRKAPAHSFCNWHLLSVQPSVLVYIG